MAMRGLHSPVSSFPIELSREQFQQQMEQQQLNENLNFITTLKEDYMQTHIVLSEKEVKQSLDQMKALVIECSKAIKMQEKDITNFKEAYESLGHMLGYLASQYANLFERNNKKDPSSTLSQESLKNAKNCLLNYNIFFEQFKLNYGDTVLTKKFKKDFPEPEAQKKIIENKIKRLEEASHKKNPHFSSALITKNLADNLKKDMNEPVTQPPSEETKESPLSKGQRDLLEKLDLVEGKLTQDQIKLAEKKQEREKALYASEKKRVSDLYQAYRENLFIYRQNKRGDTQSKQPLYRAKSFDSEVDQIDRVAKISIRSSRNI